MRASFPHVYRYSGIGRELIRDSGFFLAVQPFQEDVADNFIQEGPEPGGEPIYSDKKVTGNSVSTALKAIKPRVSRSLF